MSKVKIVHVTPDAENLITYIARVSSSNQTNPNIKPLLTYCVRHKHWSPFEMASMCVEITTSRAIAQQILRHRSFSFQEFSQRYAQVQSFEVYDGRGQAAKNRQSSVDNLPLWKRVLFKAAQFYTHTTQGMLYNGLLKLGVAREQARFLLPLSTSTRLYMYGSIRSWIHYLKVRSAEDTQLEHREIAREIRILFDSNFPIISEALDSINWEL